MFHTTTPIATGGDGARVPLTPVQRGMLFEHAVSELPGVNVEQLVCWLDGAIDLLKLTAAWRHVQARHEILRCSLTDVFGAEPAYVVADDAPLEVEVHDWRGSDGSDDRIERFLDDDRASPIDLQRAPAMRVSLLLRDHAPSVLVWTFPHALLDGRSFTLVIEEVLVALDRLRRGEDLGPAARAPQFRDHAAALGRLDRTQAEAHFSTLLSGVTEPTPLPAAAMVTGPSEPAEEERRLPPEVVAAIRALADRTGATLGGVVLVAWGIVLSRHVGRETVVFGNTRSGRHLVAGADEVVGCLVNTVPVRIDAAARRTVDDLLVDVRHQQVAVRPVEHAALPDVRSWSDVPNSLPLVRTGVVVERQLLDTHLRSIREVPGLLRAEVRERSGFDLLLAAYVDEEDDSLLLRLEHRRGRTGASAVGAVLERVVTTLRRLSDATPQTTIAELDVLPSPERHRLLEVLSPPIGPPPTTTVLDAIRDHVARTPDHPAVVLAGQGSARSYRELDDGARRLAGHLHRRGAVRGVPVALCLDRSIAAIEAMLACLHLGVPYVPVDPAYPAASISHVLQDSGATLVVTASGSCDPDVVPEGVATIDLDALPEPDDLDGDVGAPGSLDDPAYIIYTSGSTGHPKGVEVSQRSLASLCDAVIDHYELTSEDRPLQFASLSFDVSIEEIVPTLVAGATLVLRSEEMAGSMSTLLEAVRDERITVLNLPTAFWHVLVDHRASTGESLPSSVRMVVVGGERASRLALERFLDATPGVRWINAYGTTEATVTSTVHDVRSRADLVAGELPIGRPLDNSRTYVLDERGTTLVPFGEVGELWIGGHGVAEGYLGRPELTADRFRPDPWNPDGGRMYRTGDLARWSDDGQLLYLGRADRQVKVRGFRIEPGEVEAVLDGLPGIRRSVVDAHRDETGGSLVAWILPEPGSAVDDAEVLAELGRRLPSHMVPAHLLLVDAIPITPGGKVDLAALPRPTADATAAAVEWADDPLVDEVIRRFVDILGATVGPDTSFLDVGGHSLSALRLLSGIETDHGCRISMSMFYDAPTPRGVAAALRTADASAAEERAAYLVPIRADGDLPPLFGIHVLGRNEAFYRPLVAHLPAEQPVFGISIPRPTPSTPSGVPEIAALYREVIEEAHPEGPLSLAAVSLGSFVAFELAHQLRASGREVVLLALLDAAGPGGRAEVGRRERLLIHVALAREDLRTWAAARVDQLRERGRDLLYGLRRRATAARGEELPEELWLAEFVAANQSAAAVYEAEPYAGRVVVFRAAEQRFDAAEATDTALGWSGVLSGEWSVVEVPGDHMTMLQEPHVGILARSLAAHLQPVR